MVYATRSEHLIPKSKRRVFKTLMEPKSGPSDPNTKHQIKVKPYQDKPKMKKELKKFKKENQAKMKKKIPQGKKPYLVKRGNAAGGLQKKSRIK
jgi:hypothetical protein